MLISFAFLTASTLAQPAESLAGPIREAIWYDLQVNAMIGNGNWLASLWYNAGESASDLHIQDLSCRGRSNKYWCTFTLFRDGGVKMIFREQAPDRITCNAIFVRLDNGIDWAIKHRRPRTSGHSRTTMQCVR